MIEKGQMRAGTAPARADGHRMERSVRAADILLENSQASAKVSSAEHVKLNEQYMTACALLSKYMKCSVEDVCKKIDEKCAEKSENAE